jgi:hypothetical protein
MPRELTDGDKSAMRTLVGDMVGRTFQPDAGVTLGGQPVRDFLAGSTPTNPFSAMQQSAGRKACESWARGDASSILPSRELFMRDTCKPYIDSIGVSPADADYGPPFESGQCTGTVYGIRVGASFVDRLDGTQVGVGTLPFGEIGGINFDGPVTSVENEVRTVGSEGNPQSWRLKITSGSGTVQRVDIAPTDLAPVGGRTIRQIKSRRVQFFRVAGGGDTCGDPPPQWDGGNTGTGIPAPSPVTSPPGFDIPFPGITVKLNPDGSIAIDFGDGGPPLVVDPGAGNSAAAGADPGPPAAGTAGTAGDAGDAEGDAPEGKELWALKIVINSFPPRPNQYTADVFRGVCYVYMGDANGLDHDPAGAMLRSGQLVLAEREGLTKYRVAANDGYNLTVTPYWRTPRKES